VNWEALGAIAELVGSVAVVATIAYLIVQIRQNTKFAKIDAAQQLRAGMNDVLRGISDNTDALRTYEKALTEPQNLERTEKIRFDLIVLQMLRVSESLYLLYADDYLSDESWESTLYSLLFVLGTEGGQQSWQRQRSHMSTSFESYLDGRLQQGAS
jgi:hypothetical protein